MKIEKQQLGGNVNQNYDNLKYYLEEKLGFRPKLNKVENFLVNDLNVSRKYVQPNWSINLNKDIKNITQSKPLDVNIVENIARKFMNLLEKNNFPANMHKTTSGAGYIPSRFYGGKINNK